MSHISLSSYRNDWYKPGGRVRIVIWQIVSRLIFRTSLPFPSVLKVIIIRLFGARIGDGVIIKPSVHIKYPWFLSVGSNSWIGEYVWIDNLAEVSIGHDCCLSQGCYLLTGNHNYNSPSFDLVVKGITIAPESWVGAKAVVCPGVVVGRGAVITAGSVAAAKLDEFGIYKGNPAVKIKVRSIL